MPPSHSMRQYRTPIHVEGVEGCQVRVTVGGVDLPVGAKLIPLADFPEPMRAEVERGRVFFARATLAAETADDLQVTDIEREWGNTGPLHFEDGHVL